MGGYIIALKNKFMLQVLSLLLIQNLGNVGGGFKEECCMS